MAGEQIRVTPIMITWARERAGFSIDEAAEKLKKIAAWEAEDEDIYPTYPQLEEMADRFKVPIAVFFFPEPPDLPPITKTFRTLPDAEIARIEPRIRLLLRKAKAMQLSLAELNFGINPAERLITQDLQFAPDVAIGDMATAVRAYLGVSLEQQCEWADAEIALENWRKTLSDVGVFVFKDQFRAKGYSGFCLYDDVFPIIYVNNTTAKQRQIFTIFHELAHLLFHTSGIDTDGEDYLPLLDGESRRIEVIANRFAGQILVPDDAFEQVMVGQDASEATARVLATQFNVSWLVIYRKFHDRQLISDQEYTQALGWQREERGRNTGGDYYNNQMAYLGRPYIGMALREFYKNRITETQLAEYLNIAPKNVSTLEERFLRGRA
jgi:Zn-dependent peptidase ImmA (M78 family)